MADHFYHDVKEMRKWVYVSCVLISICILYYYNHKCSLKLIRAVS